MKLTFQETILWREAMVTVNNGYAPTIYIGTEKRRNAMRAINRRLEELEALVKRIAEKDPYHEVDGWQECYYCGKFKANGGEPIPHASDCIWLAAQAAKE